jgi:hypothetical protein
MFGIGSHMPILRTYWYSTERDGETRYEMRRAVRHLCDVAADAAEDYYSNYDGWEAAWPLEFVLYESEDGPAVGRFEVDCETVPQFSACERPLTAAAVDPQAAK